MKVDRKKVNMTVTNRLLKDHLRFVGALLSMLFLSMCVPVAAPLLPPPDEKVVYEETVIVGPDETWTFSYDELAKKIEIPTSPYYILRFKFNTTVDMWSEGRRSTGVTASVTWGKNIPRQITFKSNPPRTAEIRMTLSITSYPPRDGPRPPPPRYFDLSYDYNATIMSHTECELDALFLPKGGTTQIALNATSRADFPLRIEMSFGWGLPQGVSGDFEPRSFTLNPNDTMMLRVTLTADEGAADVSTRISIDAEAIDARRGAPGFIVFFLIVGEGSGFPYRYLISPSVVFDPTYMSRTWSGIPLVRIEQGESISVNFTLGVRSNSSHPILYSVRVIAEGVVLPENRYIPDGINITFSPCPIELFPNSVTSVTMTITVAEDVPDEEFTLGIDWLKLNGWLGPCVGVTGGGEHIRVVIGTGEQAITTPEEPLETRTPAIPTPTPTPSPTPVPTPTPTPTSISTPQPGWIGYRETFVYLVLVAIAVAVVAVVIVIYAWLRKTKKSRP